MTRSLIYPDTILFPWTILYPDGIDVSALLREFPLVLPLVAAGFTGAIETRTDARLAYPRVTSTAIPARMTSISVPARLTSVVV